MINWETVIISSIGGVSAIIGALVGVIIAPRLNHQYSLEKLKKEHKYKILYLKTELIHKKKLKYFERIMLELEEILTNFCTIKEMEKIGNKEEWKKYLENSLDVFDKGENGYSIYFIKNSEARNTYLEIRKTLNIIFDEIMVNKKIQKKDILLIDKKMEELKIKIQQELYQVNK